MYHKVTPYPDELLPVSSETGTIGGIFMRKIARPITVSLILLVLVCAGLFWIIQRQQPPIPETDAPTPLKLNDLTSLSVSLLPDDACSTAAQEMVDQLPNSSIIARVSATSSPMSLSGTMVQRFYILDVYAGEGLQKGDLIWLTSSQWKIQQPQASGHLQSGYVNLPQNNWDYLVFLKDPEEDSKTIYHQPVYQLRDDLTLTPILCCTDWNAEVAPNQGNISVYSKARWHEFYTQTQQGMDTLMQAKHTLLQRWLQGA